MFKTINDGGFVRNKIMLQCIILITSMSVFGQFPYSFDKHEVIKNSFSNNHFTKSVLNTEKCRSNKLWSPLNCDRTTNKHHCIGPGIKKCTKSPIKKIHNHHTYPYASRYQYNGYSQYEMPMIQITTDSSDTINSKDEYTNAKISIINNLGFSEMTDQDVSVKLHGNVTLYADKKSYKLKFDKKQNLLNTGTGASKPWCLISNCFDGSLLRNLTIYRFADMLDGLAYSPNCRSVEVFVNGEYQGVYLLCEDKNVNENRVAIVEEPDEIEHNGYFIEMSRYDESDSFEAGEETYAVKSDLSKNDSIKKLQFEYITEYITKCYTALKNGDQSEVEKYIDLQSFVDMYIGNEIVKNVDVGWSSFFLYKDDGKKLCFGPIWDLDLSMGNVDYNKGFGSWAGFNRHHIVNINACSNPWFYYALSHKWFRKLVKQRWNMLHHKTSLIARSVVVEAERNYNSYCRNYEKWDNVLGQRVYDEPEQIVALKTFREHYCYLSNWLDKRVKWLSKHFTSPDFINGVFVDHNNQVITPPDNIIEESLIMGLVNAYDVQMTSELLPSLGMTVNIEMAGTENWSAQIGATAFKVEKDTEYELSFDYKCSADQPSSLDLQQNHAPWALLFHDTLSFSNEFKHYQTTFTTSEAESNCALVFSVGGAMFNGTEVIIDNMRLVPKKS